VSRSASEPDSASLHKAGVAKVPENLKPAIDEEAMGASIRRTLRGDWGQRAWTDQSRNLGDPRRWQESCQARVGIHNHTSARCGSRTDL